MRPNSRSAWIAGKSGTRNAAGTPINQTIPARVHAPTGPMSDRVWWHAPPAPDRLDAIDNARNSASANNATPAASRFRCEGVVVTA